MPPGLQKSGYGLVLVCRWFLDSGSDKTYDFFLAHIFGTRVIEFTAGNSSLDVRIRYCNRSGVVELVEYDRAQLARVEIGLAK